MNKSRLLGAVCAIIFTFVTVAANAALLERLGGLAYYDDVADLTWLADANATGTTLNNWTDANTWAASLNIDGVTGWRLPDTLQPDPSCSRQGDLIGGDGIIDTSWGVGCRGSEMGNLFYTVLEGDEGAPISLRHNANYDLFSNVQDADYWSATEYVPDTPFRAWSFLFHNGNQGNANKSGSSGDAYAWAVHSGDVGEVPVPAAVWLFGSGLLGLAGIARRKAA
jgi:hypothetical protein